MSDGPEKALPAQGLADFDCQFHAHHGAVYHFLFRLLPQAEDVEDCVQETFLRFWRSGSRYVEQGKMRAYLLKIARNLSIDHLRRQGPIREKTAPLDEAGLVDPAPAGPGEAWDRADLVFRVRAKVGQLPQAQRETFLLFRYQGLSYRQIADIQEVSVRTVESRLYRAMQTLGQQLKGMVSKESEGEP